MIIFITDAQKRQGTPVPRCCQRAADSFASAVFIHPFPLPHASRQQQGLEWERAELRRQLQQDRAEFAAQAKLLSGHFHVSQHRSTALQVAHEALQVGHQALQVVHGALQLRSPARPSLFTCLRRPAFRSMIQALPSLQLDEPADLPFETSSVLHDPTCIRRAPWPYPCPESLWLCVPQGHPPPWPNPCCVSLCC